MNQLQDLGNDVWAIFGAPFEIDGYWREWLGSVRVENLNQTSLALIAHAQSDHPEVLDHENNALAAMAAGVFYGLLMTDVSP